MSWFRYVYYRKMIPVLQYGWSKSGDEPQILFLDDIISGGSQI